MKFENESKKIIELVGGGENIQTLVHCATRLRFGLKDVSKTDKETLEALPYVLSVVNSGGQFQVVIGSSVPDYYQTIKSIAGIDGGTTESTKTKFSLNSVFEIISGVFSPLIPAMAGAGMIKAVLTVLVQFGWMSDATSTYAVLSAASNAVFYFLPIFLGHSLATKLGANPYVGGVIGAALLEPSFTALIGQSGTDFLGIPLEAVNYATTIFPIFVSIFIYKYVDRLLKKIIFKDIQLFAVPMLSLMIMVPLTVLLFGPFGTVIGNGLSTAVMWLIGQSKILSGIVLGGGMTFMVMFGLHWGFSPITLDNLNNLGGDPIEGMALAAVFAQIGIAIGLYIRAKKGSEMRALAGPVALTGLLAGVTEPIVYGLILRYRRLIPIVAISGGLGGAVLGATEVTMNAYVFHNIFSMPVYTPMYGYLAGISVALISGAILTYFFGIREEEEAVLTPGNQTLTDIPVTETSQETVVFSPVEGEVIPLSAVEDDVFSSGAVGTGVGVIPSTGLIKAPFTGTVVTVFPSKHAIGLKSTSGIEILIHVGLDTVNLDGEHFDVKVASGDTFKQGDVLVEFDLEAIKKAGYKLTTPVIVTDPTQSATDCQSKNIRYN